MDPRESSRKRARPASLVQFGQASCEQCGWHIGDIGAAAATFAARKHTTITGHVTEVDVVNRRTYRRPPNGT